MTTHEIVQERIADRKNEGTITIAVETWSNMGRGNWRIRQTRYSFAEYDSMLKPGEDIEHSIMVLRDKIRFSDEGRVAPKT